MLSDGVWVRLAILRYEPSQWGGLNTFHAEPMLSMWEEGVQYFGVQFGEGVGYYRICVSDGLCLDWRLERGIFATGTVKEWLLSLSPQSPGSASWSGMREALVALASRQVD